MPSGQRYAVTIDGIQYNLSPPQFELLKKKAQKFKEPLDYKLELRLKGLIGKGLLKKQPGPVYVLTARGIKFVNTIQERKAKENI